MKNHRHLTVARHLREKIHPSVLVVTIGKGEERGMCSAALRELLRIVKDQKIRFERNAQLPWSFAESQQFGKE